MGLIDDFPFKEVGVRNGPAARRAVMTAEQGRTCYNCRLTPVCRAFSHWQDLIVRHAVGSFLRPEAEHLDRQARLIGEICECFEPVNHEESGDEH